MNGTKYFTTNMTSESNQTLYKGGKKRFDYVGGLCVERFHSIHSSYMVTQMKENLLMGSKIQHFVKLAAIYEKCDLTIGGGGLFSRRSDIARVTYGKCIYCISYKIIL